MASLFVKDMNSYGYPPKWENEPPKHLVKRGWIKKIDPGTYRLQLSYSFGETATIEVRDCAVTVSVYERISADSVIASSSRDMDEQQCNAFLRQLYGSGVFNAEPNTLAVDDGVHGTLEARIGDKYIYWSSGDWTAPINEITSAFLGACQSKCERVERTILAYAHRDGT